MGFFSNHVETTNIGIHIQETPPDPPAFERIYTASLNDQCSIKIRIHTFMHDRMKHGELTQKNGRWVLFDPDAVADKILDPVLLPLVEKYCQEISQMDKAYIESNPASFIDDRGQKWIKA